MQNQCCLLTNIDPTTVPKPFVKLWATCGRRRTTCRPGSPRRRFDARRFHTGSIHYAITALWTASHYGIPMTIVVASNAEYVGDLLQPGLVVGDLTGERHQATRRSPLRRAAPDKARALVGARRRSCRRRGLSLRSYS